MERNAVRICLNETKTKTTRQLRQKLISLDMRMGDSSDYGFPIVRLVSSTSSRPEEKLFGYIGAPELKKALRLCRATDVVSFASATSAVTQPSSQGDALDISKFINKVCASAKAP